MFYLFPYLPLLILIIELKYIQVYSSSSRRNKDHRYHLLTSSHHYYNHHLLALSCVTVHIKSDLMLKKLFELWHYKNNASIFFVNSINQWQLNCFFKISNFTKSRKITFFLSGFHWRSWKYVFYISFIKLKGYFKTK